MAVWLVLAPGVSLANPERQTRQAAQQRPGIQPRGGCPGGRERPDCLCPKGILTLTSRSSRLGARCDRDARLTAQRAR